MKRDRLFNKNRKRSKDRTGAGGWRALQNSKWNRLRRKSRRATEKDDLNRETENG